MFLFTQAKIDPGPLKNIVPMLYTTNRPAITQNQAGIIEANGYRMWLSQEMVGALGDILRPRIDSTRVNDQIKCRRGIESILCPGQGEHISTLGLRQILVERAARKGRAIRILATTEPRPLRMACPEATINHTEPIQLLTEQACGVITHSQRRHRNEIILDVCRVFTDSQICIVGTRDSQLRAVHEYLRKHGMEAMALLTNNIEISDEVRDKGGVIVSTIGRVDSDFCTKADLILCIDASEAAHVRFQQFLAYQPDMRPALFGLLDETKRLNSFERVSIVSTFGLHQAHAVGKGLIRRPSSRLLLPHFASEATLIETGKSRVIPNLVTDTQRNRYVAKVAKGLQTRTLPIACATNQLRQWLGDRAAAELTTFVIAATAKQALQIAHRLPGWALLTSIDPSSPMVSRMSEPDRQRLKAGLRRWNKGSATELVTTIDAAGRLGEQKPDVIVWAGAGPSVPALPKSWLRQRVRLIHPLLIVDFADRGKMVRPMTQQRMAHYDQAGIFDVGVNDWQGRYEQFERQQATFARSWSNE